MNVNYSLNGKKFEDYGAYVSQSYGLIDVPEKKPVLSQSWAEHNGVDYDLAVPMKYEQRDLRLDMFFVGEDWEDIRENFSGLMAEFDLSGTQRLLIRPFGYTPMAFDVVLFDKVELNKQFREGKMYGVCTLNLVEPNPVKTTYFFDGIELNIKYNSNEETVINIDGAEHFFSGNVDEQFILSDEQHFINLYGNYSDMDINATELVPGVITYVDEGNVSEIDVNPTSPSVQRMTLTDDVEVTIDQPTDNSAYVKLLVVTGNYSVTFPVEAKKLDNSNDYDGNRDNQIVILLTKDFIHYTINNV